MRVALYPGSFDPLTLGHLDIVARAQAVFDRVVIAVLENPRKAALLTVAERLAVIDGSIAADPRIDGSRVAAVTFDGLTVDACRAHGAGSIVRGLRAVSDFEAEMQLAHNNRALAPGIDTVCFMTAVEHGYVSSSLVKEIARFGGDVSGMVPAPAAAAIRAAIGRGDDPSAVR